ncbi:MAG: hypothetical protein ACI9YL_000958 [Luteibaculaceae bacterium]|jgi:hypothetical protein
MMIQRAAILVFFLFISSLMSWAQSDTLIIKDHLVKITKTDGYRTYDNLPVLNGVADYIHTTFSKFSSRVAFQDYLVNGITYKNVICSFGPVDGPRLIIGAHYDVCGNQEGADDNASGVVGLLELARLLQNQELNYRVDLVAYSLEEPPFFRTEQMGSFIHAQSLKDAGIELIGMISLEMIGFFKSEKGSQDYPIGILSWFYGNKGDYITVVKKWGGGTFPRKFARQMKRNTCISTKKFSGPAQLPGIDFSDHLNYWNLGYEAIMISNTGFYRNSHYHQSSDKLETLDLPKMAAVIDGVLLSVLNLK